MSVSSLALFAFLLSHQGLAYLLDRACEGHIELGLKVTLGTDARGMDTAWMASLYNSENKFICGGTLITNLFVLTAGHCLVDKLRFVRLGEKDRSCKTLNCEVVREYTVSRVIPHPLFRLNTFPIMYDIGLIKLNETVDYNDSIRPICIIVDSAVHFPNNIQGRAYGWGKTNSSAQVFSDIIMSITLTRTGQKNCSYLPVKNDQFCAVSSIGGDTCTGDSGGPLAADYVYQETKSYVQIGIVSYGSPNCNNQGVYTNVESYQDWIVEMVEKYNDTLLLEECGSVAVAVRLWDESLRSTIKGTLITDRFVLTVASRLTTDATKITARLKYYDVGVLKIDKHPGYSPSRPKRNNIALVELARQVFFSEQLKPICLQLNSIPSKTLIGVLYGNDFTDLQLTRIDDSLCSTKTKMQVGPDQFCVEKPWIFFRDSPGVVVGTYKKVNGFDRYLLVGIISYIKNGVIVYTYIPSYLDWITKKVVYENKTMHPEQTSRPPLNRYELAYRTDVSGK